MNSLSKKSLAAAVAAFVALSFCGAAYSAKGPTMKEKVAALATAGKKIPVVIIDQGVSGDRVGNSKANVTSAALFEHQGSLTGLDTVSDALFENLKTSSGQTIFEFVSVDQIPTAVSKVLKNTYLDWAATDYDLYIVATYSVLYRVVTDDAGAQSVHAFLNGKIQFMENGLDKKGIKKSTTIKTVSVSARQTDIKTSSWPSSRSDFVQILSPDQLFDKLKADTSKKIAKLFE